MTHTDKINSLEIETDEELGGNGFARVNLEDASGTELPLRVDFKWVSIADAQRAVENTFLRDLIVDEVGDADGNIPGSIADILVTRRTDDNNLISFEVLTGDGAQVSVLSGERFRA
jgi:hypothetical protein